MKGKTKTLKCKECEEPVYNVGHDAVAVTCSTCVNKMMRENVTMEHNEEDED